MWFLFHFASDDFPCRPLLRNIRSEERQTESLAFGHHLLAVSLIYERSYVAVIVESEAIDAVFDGVSVIGKGFLFAIGWANVVDGISQCRHRSSDENLGATRSIAHHLSLYATAVFVGNAHATDGSRGVESHLYHIGRVESGGIIEHQRSAAHLGVEIASYSAHRGGENACKLLEAQQFIVPRKFIGTRKAGAGEVVVKLVPNKSFPCLGKELGGIVDSAKPVGNHCSAFGSHGKLLIATIVPLHCCLRCVAAGAVNIHKQFAIEHREFAMLIVGQIVLKYLVACSAYHFDVAIFAHRALHSTHRTDSRTAAGVAGAVVVIHGIHTVGSIVFDVFL